MENGGPEPPTPTSKALLLCESVLQEANSGKITLLRLLPGFRLRKIPANLPPFFVYMQITNGMGDYEFCVEIHDLREDKVLARSPRLKFGIPDRLLIANIVLPVPPMPIPHPGKYDLVVFANQKEVDRTQFGVRSNENEERKPPQ